MARNIPDLSKAEAMKLAATAVALTEADKQTGGSEPANEDEIALAREYLAALREEARLKTLKETIKGLVGESMLERHLKALTYDGLNLVTVTPTTSTTRLWKELEADHPENAAKYTKSEPTTRMDFKKNVLPSVPVAEG